MKKLIINTMLIVSISLSSTISASLNRKLSSRNKSMTKSDKPRNVSVYWSRLGQGHIIAASKDSIRCLNQMIVGEDELGNKSFDLTNGNYEPVENWESDDSDAFLSRILFPVNRMSHEYSNYFTKIYFNPKVVLIRLKISSGFAGWKDLIYILKLVHPNITENQIDLLKEREHLLQYPIFLEGNSSDISISDYIYYKLGRCIRTTMQDGKDIVESTALSNWDDIVKISKNPEVRGIAKQIAYDVGMTSIRQFVASKSSQLATLGSKKKELEFLDKYKEKLDEIKKDADIIKLIEKFKAQTSESGDN